MKNKYIHTIDDAILNSIREGDSEYVDFVLQGEDLDLDKINAIAEQNIKKILFISKARTNKAKDDKLLEVALRLKDGIEKGLEKPISVIKDLIAKKEVSFQFRNLDRLTEAEIKDIIKGHNLLNIIEQLENDEKSGSVE
jgi:hypothetical protein